MFLLKTKIRQTRKAGGLEKVEHVETQLLTTKLPLASFLAAGEYLGPNEIGGYVLPESFWHLILLRTLKLIFG